MPDDTKPKTTLVDPPRSSTRAGSSGSESRQRTTNTRTNAGKIEEGINGLLAGIAMTFAASGNDICAVVVNERGSQVASSWAELAKTNKNVEKVLLKMIEGSAWTGVAVSTLAVAMPIAQYYHVVPVFPMNPFALKPEEVAKIQSMRAAREGVSPNGSN